MWFLKIYPYLMAILFLGMIVSLFGMLSALRDWGNIRSKSDIYIPTSCTHRNQRKGEYKRRMAP